LWRSARRSMVYFNLGCVVAAMRAIESYNGYRLVYGMSVWVSF
jgi:hypothetical protein